MKNFIKSLRLTLVFCIFFSVFYVLVLWLFAQLASPNKGNAEIAVVNGKVVGAANVGQMFTKDIYFGDARLWRETAMMPQALPAATRGRQMMNISMK